MSDKTPIPTAEERLNQIDSAVDAAVGTNQARDSKAAQEKEKAEVKEKTGVGRDHSDQNKARLLAQMEARAKAFEAQGKKEKAAEIRARMKELEAM